VFGTSRAPAHNEASSFELLPLDVCSETSVQACVQTILGRTGCIDLLVNNVGFAQAGALEETSLEDARAQFETNVFGVLRMLKAVLPVMRKLDSASPRSLPSIHTLKLHRSHSWWSKSWKNW
jgi:NAD(P)-dependent dehydrogenase (short-subunit alcohol dehydrogenase family)